MRTVERVVRPLWLPGPVHTALLALTAVVALYVILFSYRTDYAAHAAAGSGLVLVAVVVLRLVLPVGPYQLVLAVGAAWAVVVVAELTFTGPVFDPVDVSNSMLGAVLAGAALLERPARRSELPALASLGGLALVLAVGLRYGSAVLV